MAHFVAYDVLLVHNPPPCNLVAHSLAVLGASLSQVRVLIQFWTVFRFVFSRL